MIGDDMVASSSTANGGGGAGQQSLPYRPKFLWRPSPSDPRRWRHEYQLQPRVDRTRDRSIAQYLPPVMDQGSEGSCTANSAVAAMYACSRIAGGSDPLTSRMQDYYLTRVSEGSFPQDVGANTDDSIGQVIKNGGLVSESVWPYDANPAEQPPTAVGGATKYLSVTQYQPIAAASWLDGALSALDALQPTLFAMAWYEQFFQDFQSTGVLGGMGGGLAGYHQVFITGSKGSAQLARLRNSWGPTSKPRPDLLPDSVAGDFYVPWSFFTNGVVQELCALVPIGANPSPNPNPPPQGMVVSPGGPYAGVLGQTLTDLHMVAQVTGGVAPYTYKWIIAGYVYGSDNPLTNAAVLAHIGSYTVHCTVMDAQGVVVDAPATTLVVGAAPPPQPQGRTLVGLVGQWSDKTESQIWTAPSAVEV